VPSGENQGHKSWLPEVRNLTCELASDAHGFTGESVRDPDAPHAASISRPIVAVCLNSTRRIGLANNRYVMIAKSHGRHSNRKDRNALCGLL
jgi:hypothetical protein